MPSPFPGTDPYLEAPYLWQSVHGSLLFCMMENLQPQLLPRYFAAYEARLLLRPLDEPAAEAAEPAAEARDKAIIADVAVKEQVPAPQRSGSTAVLAPAVAQDVATPEWVPEPQLEIRQGYLVIRDREHRSVVTVIELLSPWNKTPGRGQDDYRDKQEAVLLSDASLVEIDLLRAGAHTVAFRPGSRPASDYRVCIHRVARPHGFEVIRFGVRDPLPRVGIPLRSGEPDVVLDLASVFNRVYDVGAYFAQADYTRLADPPLTAEDTAWANTLLRAAGRTNQ